MYMGKKALIVGGSSGIGQAIVRELQLQHYEKIIIVDRIKPSENQTTNTTYIYADFIQEDYSFLENIPRIDTLVITVGFGRVSEFKSFTEAEIINQYRVNCMAATVILNHFYPQLLEKDEFMCAVIGSIAGLVVSPCFSVYGATKAALCKLIESLNIELECNESKNRITNVSPGNIKGTAFSGGKNDYTILKNLAQSIVEAMYKRKTLYIPDWDVYEKVLSRYHRDPKQFGIESYKYKQKSGRICDVPQVKVGYLSGTFDLFHIGHLNLLKRAKEYCDYLIVGVHPNAKHKGKETFIPFEERKEIVGSIKYVDKVVDACPEDSEAYNRFKFDCLFVGSDYKGTDRFNRYEEQLLPKGVKIIYFPYTTSTSSTQLRQAIEQSD